MRILTSIACVILAAGLAAGCWQRDPTADHAATEPVEPAAEPASKPSAAASRAPAPDPPKPLADLAFKPSFRRWAVICSKEAQRAGLGDLVTAELGSLKGLKLVEREQLEAATKELELAAVGESPAAATRLKMGQLLGADALLMLSLEGSDPNRALKVVVSECLCGARLRIAYLPYDRSKADGLPRACAEIVVQVCGHFAGGIRQIVGVSPLLSKNLVDGLQRHVYDLPSE